MRPKCIGFGAFAGTCINLAGPLNEALLWCDRCEALRRRHLDAQFKEISASFEESP